MEKTTSNPTFTVCISPSLGFPVNHPTMFKLKSFGEEGQQSSNTPYSLPGSAGILKTTSTRRLQRRPSSVSFGQMGLPSP